MVSRLRRRIAGSVEAVRHVEARVEEVAAIAQAVRERLDAGGTLYTAGNGGSAAEALHLAEELTGRYRSDRAPLAAVCLNADPTALTCIANDFGFDRVFSRPCEALLRAGDVLLVFSTSGRSPNLSAALAVARERGAVTIGLLGRDGGPCLPLCDHALVIPMDDSAHVQEAHQVVMHLICEVMEGERG